MKKIATLTMLALPALLVLSTGDALAHHAMDGETPRTLMQGLLSGLAHPVIGIDHLAFIVGIGLLAALTGRIFAVPLAVVGGALAGTVLHLAGANLALAEIVIAATVLVAAALLVLHQRIDLRHLPLFSAAAGIFHGYAYAESIIGAEAAPLAAYLIGFSAVQFAIASGSALLLERLTRPGSRSQRLSLRFSAAIVGAVGLLAFWSALAA